MDKVPRSHNFRVYSQSLGPVYFYPKDIKKEHIEEATVLLFPVRVDRQYVSTAVEWSASTQSPIFAHINNMARFQSEGFGSYRFHRLECYQEVDFLGGSIVFFPARKIKVQGVRGLLSDVKEVLGINEVPGFHVILRPRGEEPLLYLANPQVENIDWELLCKFSPGRIVGAAEIPALSWERLAKKTASVIEWAGNVESIKLAKLGAARGEEEAASI
jgi:hypothetical protein